MFGIDYAWGRPSMASMRAAGVHFVCRYLAGGAGGGKELGVAEARALSAAGFMIVSVWETDGRDMREGYDKGIEDATSALAEARTLGMPDTAPIYFGNDDYDVPASDQAAINAYLDGCAHVLGRHRVGIYGGYWPVSRAMRAGHATWGWQTYAWSAGQWHPGAQLQQYSNNHVLDGVGVDYDRAMTGDYGGWHVGAVPPTPPPTDWIGRIMAEFPTLHVGDSGEDVRTLQALLNVRATDTDKLIPVDGKFGPATEARVREEQADYQITVDGIVGRETISVLILHKVA